jgi:carbonic anhydrase
MKKIIIAVFCLFALLSPEVFSQRKKAPSKNINSTFDSAKWRRDNYIVNRDSAYLNPYYAVQKLQGGNKRFQEGRSIHPRQDPALIKRLSEGQKPFATIVGCSDSRVSGEILFDQGFGDLFVARTAGQVMAEASYATIEYAYLVLKTKLVVVLGHTNCGAVEAALKNPESSPGHIVTLINAIKPAAREAKKHQDNVLLRAVQLNVLNQVNELRDLESVLSKGYNEGDLLIIGAVYDLATGKVQILEDSLNKLPKTKYAKDNIAGR